MTTGKPPSVRLAVNKALAAARKAGRIMPEHEPYAALVRRHAAAVDEAGSIADLTRLSAQITALLARLPLGEEAKPGDRPVVAAGGAGEASPQPAGLAPGVGSGPTVGDTALP